MATSPSDLVRNTYMSARHPNFSGTTGSIVSAPFVLHKDLSKATQQGSNVDCSAEPWAVYNGLFTEADAGDITSIIPIGVPPEYAILETWMVAKTGTYATADTPPIINIYGSTPIDQNNKGNLPGDLATIANMPTEVNRWWTPLSSVDRTAPSSAVTTGGSMATGIDTMPTTAAVNTEPGTGQYPMQAFNCRVLTNPVPGTNANAAADQVPVAKLGTATASLDCFASSQWYLNGSDIVMVTVQTAVTDDADANLSDCMLMGRLHG